MPFVVNENVYLEYFVNIVFNCLRKAPYCLDITVCYGRFEIVEKTQAVGNTLDLMAANQYEKNGGKVRHIRSHAYWHQDSF